MMPTRGAGAFRRYLLGSVTAKVLHDAVCPVWTASHSERALSAHYPYRRILCAIDLTERSQEVLRWASQFAAEQKAELSVAYAIAVNEESTNPGVLEVRKYLTNIARQQWDSLKAEMGIDVPFFVPCGSVGSAVRKTAHDLNADVVVIGRGRLQERLGRLRSNCYAVIRESPCPVISV
jgi:nucleotide-binding universal stress UspA family protein